MELAYQARIRQNYVDLVKNLTTEEVCDYLYQERVLTEEDCEAIRAGITRAQRVRSLIATLLKRPQCFPKFVDALRHAEYGFLADQLEAPDVPEGPPPPSPVETRDIHIQLNNRLYELRADLEIQTQVVSSMKEEIDGLQLKMKAHDGEESGYKHTLTAMEDLEKEKRDQKLMIDHVIDTLLTKERIEDDRISTLEKRDTLERKRFDSTDSPSRQMSYTSAQSGSMEPLTFRKHNEEVIKCVLIGDANVGKTCLMEALTTRRPPAHEYRPTVFASRSHKSDNVIVDFWDTAGTEDYDRLRPLAYPDTDVALLVYSISSYRSLSNIMDKWWPEFNHFRPKTPTLLIGNMKDLRDGAPNAGNANPRSPAKIINGTGGGRRRHGSGKGLVDFREAERVAQEIRAEVLMPIECSTLTGEGVQDVMDHLLDVSSASKKRKTKAASGLCCLSGVDD